MLNLFNMRCSHNKTLQTTKNSSSPKSFRLPRLFCVCYLLKSNVIMANKTMTIIYRKLQNKTKLKAFWCHLNTSPCVCVFKFGTAKFMHFLFILFGVPFHFTSKTIKAYAKIERLYYILIQQAATHLATHTQAHWIKILYLKVLDKNAFCKRLKKELERKRCANFICNNHLFSSFLFISFSHYSFRKFTIDRKKE